MKVTYTSEEIPEELWRCSVVEKDMRVNDMRIDLRKDDMIMTMLGKDNTIRYFRQIRRVKGSVKNNIKTMKKIRNEFNIQYPARNSQ